jgi:hypothetical protein
MLVFVLKLILKYFDKGLLFVSIFYMKLKLIGIMC